VSVLDRRPVGWQSRIALRHATALRRNAEASFVARAEIDAPAETIDRIAREVGADQIMMGTRALDSLGNLFSARSQPRWSGSLTSRLRW
jgi:nucleotide-binding universal stress UspA family protein